MKAPEAPLNGGVSCVACHSIVRVRSTAGQADYVIEATPLHGWAASENKILRELYDFLLRADPEPHRRSMMKPFHRGDSAKFCATCHKAHLDQPVNQFRWIRSFNDYDPWQTGPFSSGRSRGYIAAREGKNCVDCHMPPVALKDGAKVRSHRFLGANTALPTVNQDHEQLEATTAFLRGRQVSVEIFALGKPNYSLSAEASRHDSTNAKPELLPATLFARGDEQSFMVGAKRATVPVAAVIAPLAQNHVVVKRGEEVRLDVVVRSHQIGHFFPSGKVEMSEAWLELQAFDNHGQIIFWSGAVDAGKGSVDSSAHFYRSYLVDGEGKSLDKNNSWAARAAAYVNLLPPGGAEVVRYRLKIPLNCGDNLHVVAKLNYRKFSRAFTQWVFAETNLPEVPIVEMARHEVTLAVAAPNTETPAPKLDGKASIWESWSDYGWGLLAQNDFKNAEAAFLQVAQNATNRAERADRVERAEPVEAWINVGIVRLREGNLTEAREAFETAMKMGAVPFKWHYYYAVTLKAQGRYNEALPHFKKVISKFPRDRVAKIERGQLYLLMQDYERARIDFEKVLSLDPENVEAYYYLQQVYRTLGEEEKTQQAAMLYERFKASPPEISFDSDGPDAQNIRRERQPYHEHVSMPLP
jgi:tetratricopeptide (TPR) repeat protein